MAVSNAGEPSVQAGDVIANAYLRLYTDSEGHSRFEDVTVRSATRYVTEFDLLGVLSDPIPADEVVFRRVVREGDTERTHNAPRRQLIIQLSGECEVQACHGATRRLGPGSVLLVEDVDGHGHITRRVGTAERLTLVIGLRELAKANGAC